MAGGSVASFRCSILNIICKIHLRVEPRSQRLDLSQQNIHVWPLIPSYVGHLDHLDAPSK